MVKRTKPCTTKWSFDFGIGNYINPSRVFNHSEGFGKMIIINKLKI